MGGGRIRRGNSGGGGLGEAISFEGAFPRGFSRRKMDCQNSEKHGKIVKLNFDWLRNPC